MTERERLVKLLQTAPYVRGTLGEYFKRSYIDNGIAKHLLENGVIVPPCKVEDKVWYITNGKIDNAEVVCIDCRNSGNHIIAHKYIEETEEIKKLCVYFSDVNKIVYLTKEEAEQALKGGGKE